MCEKETSIEVDRAVKPHVHTMAPKKQVLPDWLYKWLYNNESSKEQARLKGARKTQLWRETWVRLQSTK